MPRLEFSVEFAVPVEEAFAFQERLDNLPVVLPPYLQMEFLDPPPLVRQGATVRLCVSLWQMPFFWLTHVTDCEPNVRFVDVQVKGPFRRWEHQHLFQPNATGTRVVDVVYYEAPLGWLGRLVDALLLRPILRHIFAFRARRMKELLEGERRAPSGVQH